MTLSITGMSTTLALQLLNATKTQELTAVQKDPANARAIANFQKDAGSITTAAQFVNNYNVYSFVMKAFNLDSSMPYKALIQQTLESDSSQAGSLINKSINPQITALYKSLGFTNNGTQTSSFGSTSWQNTIIQQYVQQQYINDESSQNAAVGNALTFEQQASSVKTWYDILKSSAMTSFMQTALGLPSGMSAQPLAQQVAAFQSKFDITTLQDPTVVTKLVQKYAMLSDAQNSAANLSSNPAVAVMSGVVSSASGQFLSATLDVSSINFSALSAAHLYG